MRYHQQLWDICLSIPVITWQPSFTIPKPYSLSLESNQTNFSKLQILSYIGTVFASWFYTLILKNKWKSKALLTHKTIKHISSKCHWTSIFFFFLRFSSFGKNILTCYLTSKLKIIGKGRTKSVLKSFLNFLELQVKRISAGEYFFS